MKAVELSSQPHSTTPCITSFTTNTPNQHVRAKSWDNLTTPKNLRKCLFPPSSLSSSNATQTASPFGKRQKPSSSSGSVNCFKTSQETEECGGCYRPLNSESSLCSECVRTPLLVSSSSACGVDSPSSASRSSTVASGKCTNEPPQLNLLQNPKLKSSLQDFPSPNFKTSMLGGTPSQSLRSRLSQSLRDKKKRNFEKVSASSRLPSVVKTASPVRSSVEVLFPPTTTSKPSTHLTTHSTSSHHTNTSCQASTHTTPSNTPFPLDACAKALLPLTASNLSQSPGSPLTNAVLQDNITQVSHW